MAVFRSLHLDESKSNELIKIIDYFIDPFYLINYYDVSCRFLRKLLSMGIVFSARFRI